MAGTLPANEYNLGGVHKPGKHASEMRDATKCSVETASETSGKNNPNVNNVKPGSY